MIKIMFAKFGFINLRYLTLILFSRTTKYNKLQFELIKQNATNNFK